MFSVAFFVHSFHQKKFTQTFRLRKQLSQQNDKKRSQEADEVDPNLIKKLYKIRSKISCLIHDMNGSFEIDYLLRCLWIMQRKLENGKTANKVLTHAHNAMQENNIMIINKILNHGTRLQILWKVNNQHELLFPSHIYSSPFQNISTPSRFWNNGFTSLCSNVKQSIAPQMAFTTQRSAEAIAFNDASTVSTSTTSHLHYCFDGWCEEEGWMGASCVSYVWGAGAIA